MAPEHAACGEVCLLHSSKGWSCYTVFSSLGVFIELKGNYLFIAVCAHLGSSSQISSAWTVYRQLPWGCVSFSIFVQVRGVLLKQVSPSLPLPLPLHPDPSHGAICGHANWIAFRWKEAKKCPSSTSHELRARRDVQSVGLGLALSKTGETHTMWMPGSQRCFSLQSVPAEPPSFLVNIHIAMVKETEIQPLPGDNSQNISAISSGLQLKTLSQTSEMIHCTWLYIIMALVIIYYPFSFFFFFSFFFRFFSPLFLLACLWRWCTAWCRFLLCAFAAAAKPVCSRTTAALLCSGLLGCLCPGRGILGTFPAHGPEAGWILQCRFMATPLSFRRVQSQKWKIRAGREGNQQQWNKPDLPS